MKTIADQMIDCLDVTATAPAFGKTHRPEEKAKLVEAHTKLNALQDAYPVTWKLVRRQLRI